MESSDPGAPGSRFSNPSCDAVPLAVIENPTSEIVSVVHGDIMGISDLPLISYIVMTVSSKKVYPHAWKFYLGP
jgi:hypothetical protein